MPNSDSQQHKRIDDIRLVLRDLLKVIKVVSLYPENNPLPQSLRRTFAEKLVSLLEEHSEIDLAVSQNKLCLGDEVVFLDHSREEALAGLFFSTGLSRLTFRAGLSVNGIYRFLEVIKVYQNAGDKSLDLASLLWEAAIPGFSFETIEDVALADYSGDFRVQEVFQTGSGEKAGRGQLSTDESRNYEALFDSGGVELEFADDDSFSSGDKSQRGVSDASLSDRIIKADSQGIRVSDSAMSRHEFIQGSIFDTGSPQEDEALRVLEAVDAMGFGDLTDNAPQLPDTTLILNDEMRLTEEENRHVQQLLTADATFSMYESTCELLKEMLHQEAEMEGFYESVTICERLCNEFVKNGKLTYASEILRYIQEMEKQIQAERPLWSERLRDAIVTAGSRERLQVLKRALNQNPELGSVELRGYLNLFGWQALMGITDILGDLLHEHHRETLSSYLAERGHDNIAVVAKGITDKRPEVAIASISVLGRIADDHALGYLKHALGHPEQKVRLALVATLETCPNDASLFLLQKLAFDTDREIRRRAVQSIVTHRGQPAFDAITEVLSEARFSHLEQDDQRVCLIAYSQLGGDQAVEYLVGLASNMSLLKDAGTEFLRDAAFEALAHNRGQRCEKALLKLAGSWRPGIKAAAAAALKQRRERLFGGTDDAE